jgi:hypothetical protein
MTYTELNSVKDIVAFKDSEGKRLEYPFAATSSEKVFRGVPRYILKIALD